MVFIQTLKYMLGDTRRKWKLAKHKAIWRSRNSHNETYPANIFPLEKVKVGHDTYGDLRVYSYRNEQESLKIGNYCSIASDVTFILSGEHNYKKFTTYPIKEKVANEKCDSRCKGPIIVEDDTWIGVGATILSGVTIGKGSIIGAGNIVSHDIPPYSIYCGGKVIKDRFPKEIKEKICEIDFSSLTSKKIQEKYELLNQEVTSLNVDQIAKYLLSDN